MNVEEVLERVEDIQQIRREIRTKGLEKDPEDWRYGSLFDISVYADPRRATFECDEHVRDVIYASGHIVDGRHYLKYPSEDNLVNTRAWHPNVAKKLSPEVGEWVNDSMRKTRRLGFEHLEIIEDVRKKVSYEIQVLDDLLKRVNHEKLDKALIETRVAYQSLLK